MPLFEGIDLVQIKAALDTLKGILGAAREASGRTAPQPSAESVTDSGDYNERNVTVIGDHNVVITGSLLPHELTRRLEVTASRTGDEYPAWSAELSHLMATASMLDPMTGRAEMEQMTVQCVLLLELLVGKLQDHPPPAA